jgi:transposase-like protein
MPRNKIQFQPGLSLPNFLSKYGTETQCRDALFRLRWPKGFICPICGHNKYCQIVSRNIFQCYNCRHQSSIISRTIFEATKLSLTKWFLGIYLITQAKDGISSLNIARTIGISYNAALRMKQKVQQTMKERDDSQPLWKKRPGSGRANHLVLCPNNDLFAI